MTKKDSYRFSFPILRWLFVLFLAAGISDFGQIPKEVYKIEAVHFSSTNSIREARVVSPEVRVVKYSTLPKSSFSARSTITSLEIIKFLSFNLSNRIQVVLKKQTASIRFFPEHIICRFLARNINSGSSEDSSDFIS